MTNDTTDIVIAQPGEVSLGRALQNGVHFANPVRPSNIDDSSNMRWLSWATGNQEAFKIDGRTALPSARGWFIDMPGEDRYPDDFTLLEAMEVLCEQRLAAECIIVRQDRETKAPRKVPSWHLPIASLFVVCQGVPSRKEMLDDPVERWGVSYSGWKEGEKSSLAFYAFVKELMDAGYSGLFHCKFSSYLTEPALKLLRSHQDSTLKFADAMRAEYGIGEPLAYYSYALPTRCSVDTITAKSKKTGESKQVYFPVPAVPLLSKRTLDRKEAALAYLESVAITDEQALILEADGRVERIVEWSAGRLQLNAPGGVEDTIDFDTAGMVTIDGTPF